MPATESESRRGIISAIYGAYYSLLSLDDPAVEIQAKPRGKLRLKKHSEKNQKERHLLAIGDEVLYRAAADPSDSAAVIESQLPRRNALFRSTIHELQCLGANLNYALLVNSLSQPEPNFRLVDRFLVSCYPDNISPLLLFTKTDLLTENITRKEEIEFMLQLYRKMGYNIYCDNLLAPSPSSQFDELILKLEGATTLFCGRSGVGKSTLFNRLLGANVSATGEVSDSTSKGRHTTTNSHLVCQNRNTFFIDSPGIKEWGILHLERREIIASFPELSEAASSCPFKNCQHLPSDQSCQVQELLRQSSEIGQSLPFISDRYLSDGVIHPERVQSLEAALNSLSSPDRIRGGDYKKPTGRLHQ